MKGVRVKSGLEWKGWEWRRIRMKGMKSEGGSEWKGMRSEGKLEWKGWKVGADQNKRDKEWRRIGMKGMKSEGGSEWKE